MRILFVTLGYPPRGRFGTEFYTHELVHGLAGRGHEPVVLHPVRDGTKPRYTLEETVEDGVRVLLLSNPGDRGTRFEPSYLDEDVERVFRSVLQRVRPDRVHFTYLLWGLSIRLPEIARELGIPSVLTLTDYGLLCHRGQMFTGKLERCGGPRPPAECARCIREPGEYDLQPAPRLVKRAAVRVLAACGGLGHVVVARDLERRERAARAALDAADALIAPTEGLRQAFVRSGVPSERLETVVYSFDETPYEPFRGTPPPTPPRFGFLAQFGAHKGLGTLLEAARLLDREDPDAAWELVLHGAQAPGRNRLYTAEVLGRRDARRVKIGEPFEPADAPRVIAGFSALVLPSAWDENAPLSVLQARSLGVPVLGTNVSGIAEALEPDEAARLVEVGDAAALARRMGEVVRGEIHRPQRPGLPLSLAAHLDKIEAVYARISKGLG